MTETELVLAAISKSSFRFARTMPQWPHEYTIRKPEDRELDKAFLKLHRAIRPFGKVEIFSGTKRPSARKYFYPGDGYRYWAESDDPFKIPIINRNTLESTAQLR